MKSRFVFRDEEEVYLEKRWNLVLVRLGFDCNPIQSEYHVFGGSHELKNSRTHIIREFRLIFSSLLTS